MMEHMKLLADIFDALDSPGATKTDFTIPVPGYSKDTLKASYGGAYLTLTSTDQKFQKRIYMPNFNNSDINLTCKDGLLTVKLTTKSGDIPIG